MSWKIPIDELKNTNWWVEKYRMMSWKIPIDELKSINWWVEKYQLMSWKIPIDELKRGVPKILVANKSDLADDPRVRAKLKVLKGL